MNYQKKLLGEVLSQIKTGSTPSTSDSAFFNGEILWFTPSDIGESKNLVNSDRTITQEALTKGKAKLFPVNSLLITCIGNIGRVGIIRQLASSNQQITALVFNDEVSVEFAYYWFVKNQFILEQQANQAVLPILNNERLQDIAFSFPSLPEQKRIAAILDKADRLSRGRRFAQTLSASFLQSVFVKMFGDIFKNEKGFEIGELGEKTSFMTSGSRGWAEHCTAKGDLFLRIQNVNKGELLLNDIAFVQAPDTAEARRTKVKEGDVLLTITAALGRTAVIPKNLPTAYINQHIALLRLKNINPTFVSRFITSKSGQKQIEILDREGVKSGLNFDDIKGIKILLPPLPLQEKFAEIVQNFERVRRQQREATRHATHLFQTLLHRAFRGELLNKAI